MSGEDIRRVVFHVDLDAFYASVEQLDNPALAGRPVIVGAAPGHRGVVSACSYEARRFGIRSAMPISQAYRRCPQGVYLPVRMERYMAVSRQVMGVLESYTPHLQQISVDEAFLDLTGTEKLFGPPLSTARRLKAEVKQATGLVISVGIGPNKYVAKLATNSGKPDGLVMVGEEDVEAFLDGIALADLWGIGEKTLQRLTELNITSVKQLRTLPQAELSRMLGTGAAAFLASATRGGDPGIFSEEPRSRSLSSERTFERDRKDRAGIERALLELCQEVVFRMIEEGWKSRTVSLKVRFHDFTTVSAQQTLKHWISSADELDAVARDLLSARWNGSVPIRLVGIGFSNLTPVDSQDQLELFTDEFTRKKRVEEAVFKIRRKLGDVSLTRASLLDDAGTAQGPSSDSGVRRKPRELRKGAPGRKPSQRQRDGGSPEEPPQSPTDS